MALKSHSFFKMKISIHRWDNWIVLLESCVLELATKKIEVRTMPYFAINMSNTTYKMNEKYQVGRACQCWDIGIAISILKEAKRIRWVMVNFGPHFIDETTTQRWQLLYSWRVSFLIPMLHTRMRFRSILWKREKKTNFFLVRKYTFTQLWSLRNIKRILKDKEQCCYTQQIVYSTKHHDLHIVLKGFHLSSWVYLSCSRNNA